jgi:hypothetical protein
VDFDIFKELDMAFVSIGQKYGFESAGDYFRKQIADARAEAEEERQRAEADRQRAELDRREMAKGLRDDGVSMDIIVRRTGYTAEQIASF